MVITAFRLSLVTFSASSTTVSGTARLFDSPAEAADPLTPFVALPLGLAPAVEPSATSSSTRRSRFGKVVTSPERRRSRACDWIAAGQSDEWALRAWRMASWILETAERVSSFSLLQGDDLLPLLRAGNVTWHSWARLLGDVSFLQEMCVDL